MKLNFAALALFLVSTNAVALPEADTLVKELEVKSDFFSGVIFSGTAESIYNEMKALNPDSIGTVAVDEDVSLTKRALQSFNCNWGSPVPSWNNCLNGMGHLIGLGKAQCRVGPGRGNYARVTCDHSCGIYLYNKLASDLWVFCGDIAKDVNSIATHCGGVQDYFLLHSAKDFDSHFIGFGSTNC